MRTDRSQPSFLSTQRESEIKTWTFCSKMSLVEVDGEEPGPVFREPPGSGHRGDNSIERSIQDERTGKPNVKCPPYSSPQNSLEVSIPD